MIFSKNVISKNMIRNEMNLLKNKIEAFNWINLQEALKLLFIFAALWAALYQVAYAKAETLRPSPQYNHEREWVFEGWHGASVRSSYLDSVNRFVVYYCKDARSTCDAIVDMPAEDVLIYEKALLSNLKELREEVSVFVSQQFWSIFTGGSETNADIKTLDEVIGTLESEGLPGIIFMTEEKLRYEAPAISSRDLMDAFVETVKKSFETVHVED